MTVFPARKHASLSTLDCCLCLCHCVVLNLSCPRAENVTYHVHDITQEESKNIYFYQ